MNKKIILVLISFFLTAQTIDELVEQDVPLSEMELGVNKPFDLTNTRREVYGQFLKRYTPGYSNFAFMMDEDEVRENIIAAGFGVAEDIIEVQSPIYYRNQPTADFTYYQKSLKRVFEFHFVDNLDYVRNVAWYEILILSTREDKDYKMLKIDTGDNEDWSYSFILYKENSHLEDNQNPYRLIAIKMNYDSGYQMGKYFNVADKTYFGEIFQSVRDTLGTYQARQTQSVTKRITKHYFYYTQNNKREIVRGQSVPVGKVIKVEVGTQVVFSYMTMGAVHGNVELVYIMPEMAETIIKKLKKASSMDHVPPPKGPVPTFQ